MDNRIEIPDYFEIKSEADVVYFIDFVVKKINQGGMEQFWIKGLRFVSSEKIEDLKGDKWPDYIEMYFRDVQNKSEYKLAVELYHGSGGAWEKLP